MNVENYSSILSAFMNRNEFEYTFPNDYSVYYNSKNSNRGDSFNHWIKRNAYMVKSRVTK